MTRFSLTARAASAAALLLLAARPVSAQADEPASPPAAHPAAGAHGAAPGLDAATLRYPGEEAWFGGVRQLTHGGQNAEAYFSWKGDRIVFQSTRDGYECDRLYTMKPDGTDLRMVSTGEGRVTCGFFFPDGKRILYASTHHLGPGCPAPPDRSAGYVWKLFDYDLYLTDGSGAPPARLTDFMEYDAEAVTSPDGKTILFTSIRNDDIEICAMDADGSNFRRLTTQRGFDGGPFFSWDGTKIVYRAFHPAGGNAMKEYNELLWHRLMKPTQAEIFTMNPDGTEKRRLTNNGQANWCPSFHPDGRHIIFSSNMGDPGGRGFDLYWMDTEGNELRRVTFGGFNAFPYFSPDGKRLLFCSDRNATEPREYNVFNVEWVGN